MTAVLLLLAGCSWDTVEIDEPEFEALATVAYSSTEAVVGGTRWIAGGARILRFSDGRLKTVFQTPSGYIAAVDRSESFTWAVLGTPHPKTIGSEYTLLRSSDRGQTWKTAGPIPFGSVAQLEAASDEELWIHATGALGRSTDGGLTWDVVHAPGERSGLTERLVAAGGEMLVLGANSIRSDDGGESWQPLGVEGELVAADDGWYLGKHEGRLAVRDPAGAWHPLSWSHPDARALTLRVEGDQVQALTTGRPETGVLRWFESRNAGTTWRKGWIRAETFYPAWAIAPDGALFAFPLGGWNMRVRRP